jgi:hypothetical protein
MSVDPFADDLATLGLDLIVAEAGWPATGPIRCCSLHRMAPLAASPLVQRLTMKSILLNLATREVRHGA